jgi:ubiquinone/menaquinone biosynthesis C-methylase UbiE
MGNEGQGVDSGASMRQKESSTMQDRPLDIGEGENPYFIYAAENNGVELARLIRQAQLILELQGELYPEQLDRLTSIRRILDVACGPGSWAIEAARACPDRKVVGFDISLPTIEHAQMFAEAEGVTNVEFCQMDALKTLGFADETFDLVNADSLNSFMTPRTWPPFLLECKRILRPGGVVKLNELECGITSSPAVDEGYRIWAMTMKQAGRSFSCDGWHLGITAMLRPLLREAGFVQIGHTAYAWECSYGSPWHQAFLEDLVTLNRHMQPFVRRVRGEAALRAQQETLAQAIADIKREDFFGIVYLLTAWGVKAASLPGGKGA